MSFFTRTRIMLINLSALPLWWKTCDYVSKANYKMAMECMLKIYNRFSLHSSKSAITPEYNIMFSVISFRFGDPVNGVSSAQTAINQLHSNRHKFKTVDRDYLIFYAEKLLLSFSSQINFDELTRNVKPPVGVSIDLSSNFPLSRRI